MSGGWVPRERFPDFQSLLECRVMEYGSKPALVFPGARLTFEQLHERSLSAAAALGKLGLKDGDRVGLLLGQTPEFAVCFLGCLAAGVIPVPMQAPRKPSQLPRLVETLKSFGTKAVVTLGDASSLPGLRCFSWEELQAASSPHSWRLKRRAPGSLAYIQCTSGSTSLPKGCCIPHRGILFQVESLVERFSLTPGDVTLNWLPFYHDMGLGYLFTALGRGFTAFHHSPYDFIADPLRWPAWLAQSGATFSGLPGFAMGLIAKLIRANPSAVEGLDCSRLRFVIVGAEQIHFRAWREFVGQIGRCGISPRAPVMGYGMSETTLGISFSAAGEEPFLERVGEETTAVSGG